MLRTLSASYESSLPGILDGIFIVAFEDIFILAFPSCPRFVVIIITPLAPFTPYTAVADASFRTETL